MSEGGGGGGARARIDLRVHRLESIKAAAYRLADRCTVVFGEIENDSIALSFTFRSGTRDAAAADAIRSFYDELLDQDLREQIRAETESVRALILAHAFSKTDLIKRS